MFLLKNNLIEINCSSQAACSCPHPYESRGSERRADGPSAATFSRKWAAQPSAQPAEESSAVRSAGRAWSSQSPAAFSVKFRDFAAFREFRPFQAVVTSVISSVVIQRSE